MKKKKTLAEFLCSIAVSDNEQTNNRKRFCNKQER